MIDKRKEDIALPIASHNTSRRLTLLPSALADLGGETSLDGSDGTPGAARVACNEIKTVLTLVELGVRGAAGLTSDVFDCHQSQ